MASTPLLPNNGGSLSSSQCSSFPIHHNSSTILKWGWRRHQNANTVSYRTRDQSFQISATPNASPGKKSSNNQAIMVDPLEAKRLAAKQMQQIKVREKFKGIVVFASVMATLGLQVLFESGRELVNKTQPERDPVKEKWMIGIMVSATAVKFVLMLYCRRFKNEIVRTYAQDHFFDVITNSIGLAAAVLAIKFYWWIDPLGAILIALYTMGNWANTVMENVLSLIGRTAPPEYLAKLTYLIWNHHEEIKHIETVRAYKFGCNYFVEVHVVLPGEMSLSHAHAIGETLQDKIEKLPEVERAFVHVDFDTTHKPEHKPKLVP